MASSLPVAPFDGDADAAKREEDEHVARRLVHEATLARTATAEEEVAIVSQKCDAYPRCFVSRS